MNYIKYKITLNGTLILAYLMFIGSLISCIITKQGDVIIATAPWVAVLAGARSLSEGFKNGNIKAKLDNCNSNSCSTQNID